MGTTAALTVRPAVGPATRPAGDERTTPSLAGVLGQLRELTATAASDAALLGFGDAADYAAGVEEISRAVDYLQLVAAAAVDRTRNEPTGAAGTCGVPAGDVGAARGRAGDDGFRRTEEFLRARLQISVAEAHRRLCLARAVLPRTGMTGQPLPPLHEELAAAVAAGAVPSPSATLITLALDRVRPLCGAETGARMEHALTRTAIEHDPDFLARITRRWLDAIDQDGAEPAEEVLRQLQGAFLRRPRHGLQHLEIFATTEQFEHLLTVMNTATNPRTTPAQGIDEGARAGTGTAECAGETARGRETAVAGGPGPVEVGPAEVGLDWRSRPQKLLDGLVGACKLALASGGLPGTGGLRPQIMVTIDYRDLLTRLGPNPGPGTGTLAFTGPVTAETIRKIACDADIIPVLLGSQGRILDIGRTSRVFPPHLRKAITARDQGCAFPDCTIPAPWCEAHHIDYWSRGGTTSTDNGTLLCSHHHHLIHKEHWTIQPRAGIPWFIPPPHLDPHQQPRRNHYFRS
ncbi:DUF222 domain-containing protein [Arthrobacter sp. UYEF3]|uniref:HNH endonuclease n=1 Tax=Arthrobacter sp. UYEF3 TaxID=1756365 RepID=UPI003396B784